MTAYLFSPLLIQAAQAVHPAAVAAEPVDAQVVAVAAAAQPLPSVSSPTSPRIPADAAPVPPLLDLSSTAASGSLVESSGQTAETVEAERASARYDTRTFWRQTKSIPWRLGGAAAAITATGIANWDWGSSSFRFNSEGWFGKDTASLGMDKLGHAYSAYVLSEFFADGIETGPADRRSAAYTGAILSMGLMTYIEVFDGFSEEHGFSYEDLVVDAAGALFSVARRSVPGLKEKLDFRLLYIPSRSTWNALSCFPKPHCDKDGAAVRSPITDYSGQRYLLALKLSGFGEFRKSPLRFVELHGGYYARGFTREEEERGDPLRRRLFFGIGLNVGELLFPGRARGVKGAAKWALDYIQLPYTAVHSN